MYVRHLDSFPPLMQRMDVISSLLARRSAGVQDRVPRRRPGDGGVAGELPPPPPPRHPRADVQRPPLPAALERLGLWRLLPPLRRRHTGTDGRGRRTMIDGSKMKFNGIQSASIGQSRGLLESICVSSSRNFLLAWLHSSWL